MNRKLLFSLSALVLLLGTGCDDTVEIEGDESGECSDGVDNDQDGEADCSDDGCAAATACAGDDDDSALSTIDDDGDGLSPAEGDCDDEDPNVFPGAPDSVGDGVDNNCDGVDGTDADGDGHANLESGGDDCDDTDAAISPSADEVLGDGIDNDCNGNTDGQLPGESDLAVLQGDQYGISETSDITSAGDVDGDGRDDLWVGAWGNNSSTTGTVGLFMASALDGPGPFYFTEKRHHQIIGRGRDRLGKHIHNAGDLDGDGYRETFFGTDYTYSNGQVRSYFVRGDRLAAQKASPDLPDSVWSQADELGQSFISPFNGSGGDLFPYVIAGPPEPSSGDSSQTEILFHRYLEPSVFTYPLGEVPEVGNVALADDPAFSTWLDLLGTSADGMRFLELGDIDGDGLTDVVLGTAYTSVVADPPEPSALVYLGSSRGTEPFLSPDDADYRIQTPVGGDGLGWSLTVADVDGDGLDDIALAASDDSTDSNGAVYLFLATTLETAAASSADGCTVRRDDADVAFTVAATENNRQAAHQVLFHPDLDGDGLPDMVVRGRTSADETNFVLRLFYSGGLLASPARDILAPDGIWSTPEAEEHNYMNAHSVGDMDGDGLQDLAVVYSNQVRILTSLAP